MVIKNRLAVILLSLLSAVFVSCYGSWNPFDPDNDVANRTGKLKDISDELPAKIITSSGKYTVLVFTDLHYGSSRSDTPEDELFEWLDLLKGTPKMPAFAISLGDSADTGSQNEYDLYLEFCEKLKKRYDLEVLNVPGNHDLYQSHWENWKKNCFPHKSFYCFRTDKFSWYALDTASGSLGLDQYDELKKAMDRDSNPKIVYTHYPILEYFVVGGLPDMIERNLLVDLFVKNNVKCSLGGHLHYAASDSIGDYDEYLLPSFRMKDAWTLVTVDEAAEKVSIEIID